MADPEQIRLLILRNNALFIEKQRIKEKHHQLRLAVKQNHLPHQTAMLAKINAAEQKELALVEAEQEAIKANLEQLGKAQHIAHASPHTSPRLRIPTQPTIPSVPLAHTLAHTGDYPRSEAHGILPITPLAAHVPSLGVAQPFMPSSGGFAGIRQHGPSSKTLTEYQQSRWQQMIRPLLKAIDDFTERLKKLCLQFTGKPLQSDLTVILWLKYESKWQLMPETVTKLSKEEKNALIFALFYVINSELSEMRVLLLSYQPKDTKDTKYYTVTALTGILSFFDHILLPFGSFLISYRAFLFAHRNFFHGSKTESEKQLSTLYQMLVQLYKDPPFCEAWEFIFQIVKENYVSLQDQRHAGVITWVQNNFQTPTWADLNAIRDLKVLQKRVTMDPDSGVS